MMPVPPLPKSERPTAKSPVRSDLGRFSDPAAIEHLWLQGLEGRGSEALSEAQDLAYHAWDTDDGRRRFGFARQALKLSPLCADAWLILSERSSISATERQAVRERAVRAGELAIGEWGFVENEGHFWGILETRPYMRARYALAENLWETGARDEAVQHLRDMLLLNPGDNQGLRYVLLSWLMHMQDDTGVRVLLEDHEDDDSPFITYTRALYEYRDKPDSDAARLAVVDAWASNQHVPEALSRKRWFSTKDLPYYSMGGEDEAACYVADYGFAWKATPGAIAWLSSLALTLAANAPGSEAVH